ncbi:MAG: hypothetical protein LBD41_03310 [Clostridiales Family XIII bacterium]|jgi:5-hydroxyisourate hydrolase-like protein (transthyretin family)|nr:hypothetical protein [Clostridiales Family XIII bacterium]
MTFKKKIKLLTIILVLLFSFQFLGINIYAAYAAEKVLIAGEAADLNLAKSYPENKDKEVKKKSFFSKILSFISGTGMPISNVGVKLYFSENHEKANVTAKNLQEANAKLFQFYGPKNKKLKTKIYFSPKEKNYILAEINIGEKTLESDADYKLVIKAGLRSESGSLLKTDEIINFKTVNSNLNNNVYIGLMVVMFAGMFGFMAFKKRRDKRAVLTKDKEKEEKINPYLIAKKTGKPVEQVIKEVEKKKARQEKINKKKTKDKDYRGKLFKVNSKKNIRDFGFSYIKNKVAKQNPNKQNQNKSNRKKKKKKK